MHANSSIIFHYHQRIKDRKLQISASILIKSHKTIYAFVDCGNSNWPHMSSVFVGIKSSIEGEKTIERERKPVNEYTKCKRNGNSENGGISLN